MSPSLTRKAADQGHAPAQFYLGVLYDLGQGVPQDYVQMAVWNRKAAEQGFAEAQYELGIMYRNGHGVPQDYAEAAVWYRKAAEQGHAAAQYSLGFMYHNGQGVPQDFEEAADWYRKAAEQGHELAANNLAMCYERGLGVPQDLEQAVTWYRKAADQGEESSREALDRILSKIEGAEHARLSRLNSERPDQGAQDRVTSSSQPSQSAPPTSESEPRYPKLSEEQKDRMLRDLKAAMEQGLLSPNFKPSFLGVDPDQFACSQHTFGGNPLPEFCSVSWNILDCFATALISVPDLHFPPSLLLVRDWLDEQDGRLTLYLSAGILDEAKQVRTLEMTVNSEAWIGSHLRPLATARGLSLGSIYWDRSGRDSLFWCDYPGRMARSKVPGLGDSDEGGAAQWPECRLVFDLDSTMREKAKIAIAFVMAEDGTVQ